jgi:uncharacterized membrane protein YfcA
MRGVSLSLCLALAAVAVVAAAGAGAREEVLSDGVTVNKATGDGPTTKAQREEVLSDGVTVQKATGDGPTTKAQREEVLSDGVTVNKATGDGPTTKAQREEVLSDGVTVEKATGDGPTTKAQREEVLSDGLTVTKATGDETTESLFIDLATGDSLPFMILLAFMMGLGKGGVPGSSTSSVALNALHAPELPAMAGMPSGNDLAVAVQVPVTAMADITVVVRNYQNADWDAITRLLAPTMVGLAVGTQLIGQLSPSRGKLMIGGVLSLIIVLNLSVDYLTRSPSPPSAAAAPKKGGAKGGRSRSKSPASKGSKSRSQSPAVPPKKEQPPAYSRAAWFVGIVGLTGGFATVLTNSMGPMLNIYLLTLKLEPFVFVATRATFFTVVNAIKIVVLIHNGILSPPMLLLGMQLGVASVFGVLASKHIVKHLSRELFTKMEYILMSYAGAYFRTLTLLTLPRCLA